MTPETSVLFPKVMEFTFNMYVVRVIEYADSIFSTRIFINYIGMDLRFDIGARLFKKTTFEEAKKWGVDKVKEYCVNTLKLIEEGDAVATHSTET